jgi:hypothetical protein
MTGLNRGKRLHGTRQRVVNAQTHENLNKRLWGIKQDTKLAVIASDSAIIGREKKAYPKLQLKSVYGL